MQWSRAKKQFESLLAPSLQKRLRVHVTEYSKSTRDPSDPAMGRGWITVDGDEVISMQIPLPLDAQFGFVPGTMSLGQAVRAYLGLTLEDAMASEDAVVRGLTFLDRRFGKRRLRRIERPSLDGFSALTFQLRCQAEGLKVDADRFQGASALLAEGLQSGPRKKMNGD